MLDAVVDGDVPLVVDLSGVTFVDSSILHVLVTMRERARHRGGLVVELGGNGSVEKVLRVAGLLQRLVDLDGANGDGTGALGSAPRSNGRPAGPALDYAALFAATPTPYLVLTPDLLIRDVNEAYLQATARKRDDLLDRHIFEAFPDNPSDPGADGVHNLGASLERVLATGEPDTMAVQKYDIPVPPDGRFEERWWSPINTPVLGKDGSVTLLIHRVEDVTDFVREREVAEADRTTVDEQRPGAEAPEGDLEAIATDLYGRAQELQKTNEELREAHAREHEVALSLQRAMLPAIEHGRAAVRYLPAVESLNVGGDWYDLVDLDGDRVAVAIGDVVGKGVTAAGVMGQLRSALAAAIRVVGRPARALDVLDLYARSIEGALSATAAQVVVDLAARTVTYSRAGHPPPMMLHPDGAVALLDGACDVPLGVSAGPGRRPQARVAFASGATLVLYTDGLVERPGEGIDTGLQRLGDSLACHADLQPATLADAIFVDLGVVHGARDDIALVVVRL